MHCIIIVFVQIFGEKVQLSSGSLDAGNVEIEIFWILILDFTIQKTL